MFLQRTSKQLTKISKVLLPAAIQTASVAQSLLQSNIPQLTQIPLSTFCTKAPCPSTQFKRDDIIETKDFYIQQFEVGCLASFAYYIESNGEACILDPLREIDGYLEVAKARGAKVKYILESHFHADFVSGHQSLAKATGAQIVYGPGAKPNYDILNVADGESLKLGKVEIELLHTPGHTLESSCFLLKDSSKKPYALFSGDTVFLNEVGRPDLAVKAGDITEIDLAGMLYDSIQKKIMPLADDVIIFPSHGAGSSCGKNISKGKYCTLGNQKKSNYALQSIPKEKMIKLLVQDLPTPPSYFFYNAGLNKTGYNTAEKNFKESLKPFTPLEISSLLSEKGYQAIDCRDFVDEKGLVPGSINVGLSTPFAVWIGSIIPPTDKIIIISNTEGQEEEAAMRLARIGFDNVIGYLKGGIEAWVKQGLPLNKIKSVEGVDLIHNQKQKFIVDVRNFGETKDGKLCNAKTIPLGTFKDFLTKYADILPSDENIHVYCRSGARAQVATSILMKYGFKNAFTVKQGYSDLESQGATVKSGSY